MILFGWQIDVNEQKKRRENKYTHIRIHITLSLRKKRAVS